MGISSSASKQIRRSSSRDAALGKPRPPSRGWSSRYAALTPSAARAHIAAAANPVASPGTCRRATRIDRIHSDRASKAGALPGLAAPARVDPCRRCVWPKTSSWCDGRFASFGRVSPIRDEAESALVQRVVHQSCCERRFAFSPLEAAECKIMPQFCTSASRAAAARDPQAWASPGALDSLSSRTKSPETPSVAYHLFALRPSCF